VLPPNRAVVTCHDVDAFAPLLDDGARSSRLPRWLARRVLAGLQRAAAVVCVSEATRADLVRYGLVDPARLRVVPNGVELHPEPDAAADLEAARLLGNGPGPDLLHVGSTVARKRIDLLLEVFARVAVAVPSARLVRAGGRLTAAQYAHARRLGIEDGIVELPFVDRRVLAAIYRRAALLLLPSEREGFGLPVVEALAAGTPVVVSDVAALTEIGGDAVTVRPVGAVADWAAAALDLLRERAERPSDRAARIARGRVRAARWSWPSVASQLASTYADLAR
jgi:glycosyltransferase involved in cell wall biosynthesis